MRATTDANADTFLGELVAFAKTIEEIVLEGCGGEAMRVERVARAGESPPSLARAGGVDDDVVAAVVAPVLDSALEVGNAASKPDWSWRLERVAGERVVFVVATTVRRLATAVDGVPEAHRAFAAEAEAGLRGVVDGAHTFELVSNHALSCCGSGVYVLETPGEWIVVQLYAFC